jgi:hypothetical protein
MTVKRRDGDRWRGGDDTGRGDDTLPLTVATPIRRQVRERRELDGQRRNQQARLRKTNAIQQRDSERPGTSQVPGRFW